MLKVNNVSLNFNGLDALSSVNLEVKEGLVTALIGPNGAGKTTLFNVITGVYKPDKGNVEIDGLDLYDHKSYEICFRGIARTFQVIKLFNGMTVLDNVLVGMHTRLERGFIADMFHLKSARTEEKAAIEKAMSLLNLVGLDKYKDYPAGILSYGQQRLLEIARAMASDPKYLLLDEPAAGMNSKEKMELNKMIEKIIEKGTSVLIVEHDMSMVMNIADVIYVISSGKNLAYGKPEEIRNNKEVIEAYLGRGEIE